MVSPESDTINWQESGEVGICSQGVLLTGDAYSLTFAKVI